MAYNNCNVHFKEEKASLTKRLQYNEKKNSLLSKRLENEQQKQRKVDETDIVENRVNRENSSDINMKEDEKAKLFENKVINLV